MMYYKDDPAIPLENRVYLADIRTERWALPDATTALPGPVEVYLLPAGRDLDWATLDWATLEPVPVQPDSVMVGTHVVYEMLSWPGGG